MINRLECVKSAIDSARLVLPLACDRHAPAFSRPVSYKSDEYCHPFYLFVREIVLGPVVYALLSMYVNVENISNQTLQDSKSAPDEPVGPSVFTTAMLV